MLTSHTHIYIYNPINCVLILQSVDKYELSTDNRNVNASILYVYRFKMNNTSFQVVSCYQLSEFSKTTVGVYQNFCAGYPSFCLQVSSTLWFPSWIRGVGSPCVFISCERSRSPADLQTVLLIYQPTSFDSG